MRRHNGMRPQDVAVLLKLISWDKPDWQVTDLAFSLYLSQSNVCESLHRSFLSGLLDDYKRKVNRENLVEFLTHGFRYVFPIKPGALELGTATAHSHPGQGLKLITDMTYVWKDAGGDITGLQVVPLYPKQIFAVRLDQQFYDLLAYLDILRLPRPDMFPLAISRIKSALLT